MNLPRMKKFQEVIQYLESQTIPAIFEALRGEKMDWSFIFFNAYTVVSTFADLGDKECQELYDYYNQIIENYIIDCKKKLIEEEKSNLIDGFLFHSKNINFVIYHMQRIFSYLDRFYTIAKVKVSLSKSAMNLYKSIFYEEFKNKIQDEINTLEKEEKIANDELSSKIHRVKEILEEVNLENPQIVVQKRKIIKWENQIKGKYY